MATRHKRPRPRFYVATYGDMGIEVTFFQTEKECDEAAAEAEKQHDNQELDTYTYGPVSL